MVKIHLEKNKFSYSSVTKNIQNKIQLLAMDNSMGRFARFARGRLSMQIFSIPKYQLLGTNRWCQAIGTFLYLRTGLFCLQRFQNKWRDRIDVENFASRTEASSFLGHAIDDATGFILGDGQPTFLGNHL
jgi:hypothetical protein